jgi:riboflavin kinase/FMN adenylyltransferase
MADGMVVVAGIDALTRAEGRLFIVVGVFDGLHLGHAYLLRNLGIEARRRSARPTVITFDHHPDEVLTGHAPPLLLDADERLERLAAAGIEVTVVQHFDEALRRTTYDAFVERIRDRVEVAGFLMTPDAAFGHERRGTPTALAELGTTTDPPFDVVVVPPFELDGRPVRSSDIRAAVASGDLVTAAAMLGRPYAVTGRAVDGLRAASITPALPMALPPDGPYRVELGPPWTRAATADDPPRAVVEISDGHITVAAPVAVVVDGPRRITFGPDETSRATADPALAR